MKRLLLLSGFVFIIAQVRAQYDIDLWGKGARAAGMAYAFNAVADDATALSWNPAGIVQIKKPELAFSNSLKNTEYRHAVSEYDYKPVYSIDFLGFVYPIKLKKKDLVFGISYQNKMNFKYDYENLPDSEGNKLYGNRNLTVNSVSLSGAYSINRFIGVGISYNQWFSLGNKSENHKLSYGVYADKYVSVQTENYNYSGNNFTAAFLLDFSSWHFPLRYTLKFDSKMWLKDDYKYIGHEDLIYYNGADTTYLNLILGIEKFEYPSILTNGFAYRIGNYLTIAGDFDLWLFKNKDNSWTYDFSQTRRIVTNNQTTIWVDSLGHLKNTFYYHKIAINHYNIGLEYILNPKFGLIPIRTGWKCSPTNSNTLDSNGKELLAIANSISFGTGITLKHFSIDMAYEAFWFHRKDKEYLDEKQIDHFFVLSAIWYIK